MSATSESLRRSVQRVAARRAILDGERPDAAGRITCTKCIGSRRHPAGLIACPRCNGAGRIVAPECPTPAVAERPAVAPARMRRRAIWCCLKFGLLPSPLYEAERHYDGSYWAHLRLNAVYGWRWLRGRHTDDDVQFELETNW